MIEIGTAYFTHPVPWDNTDEEWPDVEYIWQQLYAQMMGWA